MIRNRDKILVRHNQPREEAKDSTTPVAAMLLGINTNYGVFYFKCYRYIYGHHVWEIGHQPDKVVDPARGQLNREIFFFPCPRWRLRIWSLETGSAVPSRASLLILYTQAEPGAYSGDSSVKEKVSPIAFSLSTLGNMTRCVG